MTSDAVPPDWTCDETGASNSSPVFLHLCAEMERLIRSDAHALIGGRADRTARLIMAQLAHRHGMTPHPVEPLDLLPFDPGSRLSGVT